MNAAAEFPLTVAGLTIDPVCRRITGADSEVAVEPMVMELLIQLLDQPGQVQSRRQLFRALWGKADVGDDSLNRLVTSLRKALSQTSNGAVQIETVPRVGYRLIVKQPPDDDRKPVARRTMLACGTSLLIAAGGAGLWRIRRGIRDAEVRQLVDRGDGLLRDAAPPQADEALPSLRSALSLDPDDSTALGLLALAEETRANTGGSDTPGETLRTGGSSRADARSARAACTPRHDRHDGGGSRLVCAGGPFGSSARIGADKPACSRQPRQFPSVCGTNVQVLVLQRTVRLCRSGFADASMAAGTPPVDCRPERGSASSQRASAPALAEAQLRLERPLHDPRFYGPHSRGGSDDPQSGAAPEERASVTASTMAAIAGRPRRSLPGAHRAGERD